VKSYLPMLSANLNRKGVLDVDTVKGCELGVKAHGIGGCYGLCYAYKMAELYGFDFSKSVSRKGGDKSSVERVVRHHPKPWFRIGTMGDPCHDWDWTVDVCEWLGKYRTPVVVTKSWKDLTDDHVKALRDIGAVVNISTSPLDSDGERDHRLMQYLRLKDNSVGVVLRVVTARFGKTIYGQGLNEIQRDLFARFRVIDNPLRIPKTNQMVIDGHIIVERHKDLGGGSCVSIANRSAFLGTCDTCPDQCGVKFQKIWIGGCVVDKQNGEVFKCGHGESTARQADLFMDRVEFEYVKSVIGSGYEEAVAKLAIEDKVAYRAARKNMQIHSAIILKINGEFSGFFTFQVNHDAGEFCLLQSAMLLDRKDKAIYSEMVNKIIEQNTYGYPMIMTVSTKHDLECPKVFNAIGFQTYLTLSGFEYMVYGTLEQVRMKRLAHATMTNTWNSVKGDWLKMKKEWNERIEAAGEKHGVPNPKFASREGCWQGESGFSNVVLTERSIDDDKVVVNKGKSLNGNASVLDPVACECILRFFMPKEGKRIYNPFGGGVQFGFVAGAYGYEYTASEIRQNQCDANNKICSEFPGVRWAKSDSATYQPEGMFDLVFTCPPYYRVEKYVDYDGQPPEGEINHLGTYNDFRDTLFAGYKVAIDHLNDNRFFVVMTGDSRDKNGSYHCHEAETEIFFKESGLSVYNKIIYLESEFTRLAQAKKTLDYRKFPKREQKIIVAYKGDASVIKDTFPPIGRL